MDYQATLAKLFTANKGILASDESIPSANKKLVALGLEPTELNRIRLRDLIINTPHIEDYLSGIILSTDTFFQQDLVNIPFVKTLTQKNMVLGVKVDKGLKQIPDTNGEYLTVGVDSLDQTLINFYDLGARFTKWRAIFPISKSTPSQKALTINAEKLGEFALWSFKNKLIPFIEPEVLYEGTHTIAECEAVTNLVLAQVFKTLDQMQINVADLVLKTSMVLPGKQSTTPATAEEVAQRTIATLLATVPKTIGGVVFLSGGQSKDQSINNMRHIHKLKTPWPKTFSFLRAAEQTTIETWRGNSANTAVARDVFLASLQALSKAVHTA